MKRQVKVRRGFFGRVFMFLFIIWNVVALYILIDYFRYVDDFGGPAVVVSGIIVFFWCAGDLILGSLALLTRSRTIIIEEFD